MSRNNSAQDPEILQIERNFLICRIHRSAFVNELVRVTTSSGALRYGVITNISGDSAVVTFSGNLQGSSKDDNIQFLGEALQVPLSSYLLNKSLHVSSLFSSQLNFIPTRYEGINTPGFSPTARVHPTQVIETGVSIVDLFMPILRGQKIALFTTPLFDRFNLITSLTSRQTSENQLVVLVLCGVTPETYERYLNYFTAGIQRFVIVYSLQSDPVYQQYITARVGASVASFFSTDHSYDVTVVYNDFQKVVDSLRELALTSGEVPGRKNYPTYLYSELAYVYERCGVFRGREGSLTAIPIVPLENDNLNHPLPDLTGYITEGQIVVTNELVRRNYSVPIELRYSLSRMLSSATKVTFPGHALMSDQVYYSYTQAIEAESTMRLVGEEEVSDTIRALVDFKRRFEEGFLNQPLTSSRSLQESSSLLIQLLGTLPPSVISRELSGFLNQNE